MSSSKVVLRYFPLRARGELPRLIMQAGGIQYKDETIPFDQWPSKKEGTIFGTLPVLLWDDEEIGQSLTICRFLARKAGLAGKNDLEMAKADMIAEEVNDVLAKYFDFRFAQDVDTKKAKLEDFLSKVLPNFLKNAEKVLKKNGGKFFNGAELTYGDLSVFMLLDKLADAKEMKEAGFTDVYDDILKEMSKFPLLADLHKAIREHPKVAAYLHSRPAYPF